MTIQNYLQNIYKWNIDLWNNTKSSKKSGNSGECVTSNYKLPIEHNWTKVTEVKLLESDRKICQWLSLYLVDTEKINVGAVPRHIWFELLTVWVFLGDRCLCHRVLAVRRVDGWRAPCAPVRRACRATQCSLQHLLFHSFQMVPLLPFRTYETPHDVYMPLGICFFDFIRLCDKSSKNTTTMHQPPYADAPP